MVLKQNFHNSRNFFNARITSFPTPPGWQRIRNLLNVKKEDLRTVHFNNRKAKNSLADESTECIDVSWNRSNIFRSWFFSDSIDIFFMLNFNVVFINWIYKILLIIEYVSFSSNWKKFHGNNSWLSYSSLNHLNKAMIDLVVQQILI